MRHRLVAWALLSSLALTGHPSGAPALAAGPAGQGPAAPAGRPVPVILLHGAGASPASWGVPDAARAAGSGAAADSGGLYGALLAAGYEDGVTLFVPDLRDRLADDPLAGALGWLAALVEEARAASGAPRVDLVAHGTMALAARYYAGDPSRGAAIRTVVLLAPPNAGSEAATALRLVALLEGAKAGPVADALLRGLGRVPIPEPDPAPVPFAGEAEYVRERARRYFYPLYRRYAEAVDRQRPEAAPVGTAGFDAWWQGVDAEGYWAATAAAQDPPFPGWTDGAELWTRPPEPGEALTLAFFEAEARALARTWHARAIANRGEWALPDHDAVARRFVGELVLAAKDLGDLVATGGWWAAVKAIVGRATGEVAREAVLALAGEAAVAVAENLADDLADTAVLAFAGRWSGVAAGGMVVPPVLDRLVTETVVVGGAPAPQPVLANAFLRRWNREDAARRRPPAGTVRRRGPARLAGGPRYVVVAGQTLNAWAILDPAAPANDGVVSVAATLIPPEEFDVHAVFASTLRTSHGLLPRHPAVVAFVAEALRSELPETGVHTLDPAAPAGGGLVLSGRAGLWAPAAHRLEPPPPVDAAAAASGGAPSLSALEVALEVQRPVATSPDGARLAPRAWLVVEDAAGAWADRVPIALEPGGRGWRGTARLDGLGTRAGRAWVALRLVPADGDWAGLERWTGSGAGPAWPYRVEVRPPGGGAAGGEEHRISPEPAADRPERSGRAPTPPGPPAAGAGIPGPTVDGSPGSGGSQPAGGSPGGAGGEAETPRPRAGTARDEGGSPGPSEAGPPAGGELQKPPANITVVRRNRRTSYKQPQELAHARWRWSVDGGSEAGDPRPEGVMWRLELPADRPWTVWAAAEANTGKVVREARWTFRPAAQGGAGAAGDAPAGHALELESVRPPGVRVWLEGPARWITGRPATFTVHAALEDPPNGRASVLTVEPSRTFTVTWTRAGRFTVTAAVTVKVSYVFPRERGCAPVPGGELCRDHPERRTTAYNIYVAETSVDVLTTGLGD